MSVPVRTVERAARTHSRSSCLYSLLHTPVGEFRLSDRGIFLLFFFFFKLRKKKNWSESHGPRRRYQKKNITCGTTARKEEEGEEDEEENEGEEVPGEGGTGWGWISALFGPSSADM